MTKKQLQLQSSHFVPPDYELKINYQKSKVVRLPNFEDWVQTVGFSNSGDQFACGGDDNSIKIFETKSMNLKKTLSGHSASVTCLEFFHPDDKQLTINQIQYDQKDLIVSSSLDRSLKIWSSKSQENLKSIDEAHEAEIHSISLSTDNKNLLSGGDDMIIKIWDLTYFTCNHSVLAHNDKIVLLRYIPNNIGFVSVGNDNQIKIWDQKPRKKFYFFNDKFLHLKVTLKDYHNIGWASSLVSLSKNGDRMAVAGPKTSITIFNDFDEQKIIQFEKAHKQDVQCVLITQNGINLISSDSKGKSIKLWNINTKQLITKLKGHQYWINSMHFSYDEAYIITGSWDKSLRIWSFDKF